MRKLYHLRNVLRNHEKSSIMGTKSFQTEVHAKAHFGGPLGANRCSKGMLRLTWLAVAPADVGDSAPSGPRKRGGLSTGEFRRR